MTGAGGDAGVPRCGRTAVREGRVRGPGGGAAAGGGPAPGSGSSCCRRAAAASSRRRRPASRGLYSR